MACYVTAASKQAYSLLKECNIVNKARPCKVGIFMSVTNKVSEDMENQISTDKHVERHYLGLLYRE